MRWLTLDPRAVERILTGTGQADALPVPTELGQPRRPRPELRRVCEGTLARNGIYGRGIVNTLTAVLD